MTNRFIIITVLVLFNQNIFAQNKLENNFGIHAQLFGIGANYEHALSNDLAVNTLINYEGGFFQGLDGDVNYLLTTTFAIEPRWYHNRKRRFEKSKNISNNIGNFLSGEVFYVSDLLSTSSDNRAEIDPSFALGIKYGLRRKLIGDFNFELAFGIAQVFPGETENFTAPLLDIKFQYIFK